MIIRLPRRVLPILRIGWREQSRPRAVARSQKDEAGASGEK
jgi:hypothetical protein